MDQKERPFKPCDGCGKQHNKPRKLCPSCVKKKWRLAHPIEACYENLRTNSKRRKIFFDITFDEFKEFLYDTEYMEKKGRGENDLTIDRVRSMGGYTRANLAILKKKDNSKKYHEVDKREKTESDYEAQKS